MAVGIIVDGVGYTEAQVRRFILERYELASAYAVARAEAERVAAELRVVKDTLRLRSLALNRLIEERNEKAPTR